MDQEVFVAYFCVAIPEQGRSVFDRPAHEESPVACRLPQPPLAQSPPLRHPPSALPTRSLQLRAACRSLSSVNTPVSVSPPGFSCRVSPLASSSNESLWR